MRFIVQCRKIAPEDRDIYRAHAADYRDVYGGEDGPQAPALGSQAVYTVELDEGGREAFERASNLISIEPDVEDRALSDVVDGSALEYHELDRVPVAEGVLIGVGDTGAPSGHPTVRLKEKWTWFSDDGMDRDGHGTWCCGAALATGGWIASGKVLGDDGSGSRSGVIAFIRRFVDYCQQAGKPGVCSLSLGGPGFSQAYQDAIAYALSKGVVTVCAAGNGGREGEPVNAPANSPSAVAVAALDHRTGGIASFSCRGPEVDIAAAGVRLEGLGLNGGRAVLSGTSMATPLVARAVAHLLSVEPDAHKVVQALLSGALDTPHPVEAEGHGTLRALHSLEKLRPCGPKPSLSEVMSEYWRRRKAWQACREGKA
jgi:subtilisin family serine protease